MMEKNRLRIGCIADDFTGAGDVASFLKLGGFKTLLLTWPCSKAVSLNDYDAVVIALKSRTQPTKTAVVEALEALKWLKTQRAEKYYFKYCSTFDSTRQGNIGPVADAALKWLNFPYTILCPTLLPNGRSVKAGILSVNGIPLAESPMKDHPLNPMWSSEIVELMREQSEFPVFVLRDEEYKDEKTLYRKITELERQYEHFYLVPDYFTELQGRVLVERFAGLPLWTGGSGLLECFAKRQGFCCLETNHFSTDRQTGRLMLAGSCSAMTHCQVNTWLTSGGKGIEVKPGDAFGGRDAAITFADRFLAEPTSDLLYYSSGSAGERIKEQDAGISAAMEVFMAEIVFLILSRLDVSRLIVAGGETSGAVIKRLGYQMFDIGVSIAPGIPVLHPVENRSQRIILKSGNFGDENFFVNTLKE